MNETTKKIINDIEELKKQNLTIIQLLSEIGEELRKKKRKPKKEIGIWSKDENK